MRQQRKCRILLWLMVISLLCCACRNTVEEVAQANVQTPVQAEPFRKSWERMDPLTTVTVGSPMKEDETALKYGFGEYVWYQDAVYFRRYRRQDFENSTLGESFGYVPGNEKMMACYTADGTYQELFKDTGVGAFYIFKDRFYGSTSRDEDGEVYTVDLNGNGYHTVAQGTLIAADEKSGYLIGKNREYGLFSVNLNTDAWVITPIELNGTFLAIENGLLYYAVSPEKEEEAKQGSVIVKRISTDGIGQMTLMQTPPDLYEMPLERETVVRRVQLTEDTLYFSYGSLGGSASYWQGGAIAAVKKDGTQSRRLTKTLVGELFYVHDDAVLYYTDTEEMNTYHTLDLMTGKTGDTSILVVPPKTVYMKDGEARLTDANGDTAETIFTQEELTALELSDEPFTAYTDDDHYYAFLNVTMAGQYVLSELYRFQHEPDLDIGMRTAYRLASRAVLCKDRNTGEIRVLYHF